MGSQQQLWRRIKVGDELFGQRFDRLTAINEMRLWPVSVDGPERFRQALDQASMAIRLAPDEALRQESALQQGRARSPTGGEDKNGLFAAIAACIGPAFEEGSYAIGNRVFGIKVIHPW